MKKTIIKALLGMIILYPILYFAFYFDNMSYKQMPSYYWLIVLIADIATIFFLTIMEHLYYKKRLKSKK